MKTLIIALIVYQLVGPSVCAQSIVFDSYSELVQKHTNLGTSLGFTFLNGIETGAFFQRNMTAHSLSNELATQIEQEFFGLYIEYPLIPVNQNLEFYLNIRTGITNGENLYTSPSFKMEYKLNRSLCLGLGVGERNARPTFMANFKVNVLGRRKLRSLFSYGLKHNY